jgi:signal peptidase I
MKGKHLAPPEMPSVENLRSELKREKYKRRFRRVLKSTVYTLIVVAALAALIATLVLPVLQIAGSSMEPTLNNEDLVLLVKSGTLQRGDLCAFYYSNKILIKRVVGLPGEYIQIGNDGTVYVNGEPLEESYLTELALGECDIEFPYQVPEQQYFLLGDQRKTSIDSRSSVIGCVAQDQILGKLICRFWPLDDFTWLN